MEAISLFQELEIEIWVFLNYYHLWRHLRPTKIIHKMIMSLPVPYLLFDHVRADVVKPFGITCDLRDGNMGFIEPAF